MARNRYQLLIFTLIISALFLAYTATVDEQNRKNFEEHYAVHSLELPETIQFAGEQIALDEADLRERYDRELLTNIYWQSQTLLFIKRAHKYFPLIETILQQEGVPDDFKYLALAESGLQYTVVSPSGAAGMWQFLDGTAKQYGLIVNDETDERYHLEYSTVAACAYFKEAYKEFNNWSLVAASYNMGKDGIRKQLAQQQATTYHDLYLNSETSRYLFRILAIKEIIEHPDKYGFHLPPGHLYPEVDLFRVKIGSEIPDLAAFAKSKGITYKLVKLYNPWIRKQYLRSLTYPTYLSLPAYLLNEPAFRDQVIRDTLDLSVQEPIPGK